LLLLLCLAPCPTKHWSLIYGLSCIGNKTEISAALRICERTTRLVICSSNKKREKDLNEWLSSFCVLFVRSPSLSAC
jgi:hypothetical protein